MKERELLEKVQEYVLDKKYPIPRWRASEEEKARFRAFVAQALVELNAGVPDEEIPHTAEKLARMMAGMGLLEEVASDDGVEEVIVRRGHVLVERRGVVERLEEFDADDEYFLWQAHRAADLGGRAMKADKPYVLVDLPDGSRFTAIIPPLSVEGTAINVRVFRKEAMTFADLTRTGTFDGVGKEAQGSVDEEKFLEEMEKGKVDPLPPVAKFLATVARYNLATVLISGEFSSGKTTLLNAMTQYIPDITVLAVIETFRELKIAHPYPVRAVVPEKQEKDSTLPTMAEVVNVVYTRMRPDVIVFGEVVGPEAVPLLDAINLSKRVLTTIHGDSAYDALLRLEMAALPSGLPLPAIQERIGRGIDLVVHMRRRGSRRYVEEIVAVRGFDRRRGRYILESLYRAGEVKPRPDVLKEVWQRCSSQ